MTKYRTYVYKLYPTKKQIEQIEKNIYFARYVYNKYLEIKIEKYNKYKEYINECLINQIEPSRNIINEINKMPPLSFFKTKHPFLKEADSIALDTARTNVKNAFQQFYKHITKFPKYKKKSKVCTYTTRYINNNIQFEGNKIRLPKIGFVKSKIYKEIPEEVKLKMITIKSTKTGKYYVSVTFKYDEKIEVAEKTGEYNIKGKDIKGVGIDFNIKKIIVTNEGYMPGQVETCNEIEKKIEYLSKKLNNKKIHSRNWYKELNKIRKLYRKQRNIRRENLYLIVNKLVKEYNLISKESISIKEMAKEVYDRKSLYGAGYYKMCKIIKEKLEENDLKLIEVDKYFRSSQICSNCKNINKELEIGERIYKCKRCGYEEDRDINAAKNLLNEGIRIYNRIYNKNKIIT